MIRAIQPEDIDRMKSIWEKFYQNDMPFPNFFDKYLCAFVVEDEGRIITGGGVRTIVESIILTDKSQYARSRVRALMEMLEASKFVASRNGYNNLNVFTQDVSWKNHLMKVGFKQEAILSLEL